MGALDRVFRGRRGGQERPAAAIVAGLWRHGEQGVWYDSSDLSTMYQDAAGTTPCYQPGQGQVDPPVGMWLDKRLGLALGPELVSNGDFATDTWWSKDTGVAITGGACVLSGVTTSRGVYRSSLTQVGKCYVVTYTVVVNSGAIRPLIAGSFGVSRTASGTYTEVLSGTSGALFGLFANPSFDGAVDNVSLREVLGNHAYQTTTTSRPTLSARYNLLTATEFPNGISDAPSRAGLVTASALPGYAGALAFGYDGVNTSYAYKAGSPASTTMTLSFVVKMDDGGAPSFGAAAGAANSDFALVLRNASIPPATYRVVNLGGGYYRVSGTQASGVGSDGSGIVKYAGNSPRTFKVTAFDLRPANDGVGLPPYQRVVDANTYDATGFPLYLKFDGVDDFLQTASVDFSASGKMFVSTAFRKLSDAARGMLYELSSDLNVNAGAFAMEAPDAASAASLRIRSNGTTQATASAASLPAPGSFVTVHSSAISEPLTSLRVNGAPVVSSTSAQGSGNFGNYPLYIGRRGGASLPFNGRLYGLLVRGAATPDATIAKVERYLNSKARAY